MIYFVFLVIAAIVVVTSVFLAKYAEIIEANTAMNGVFIGLLLAAATSLPELVSSVTAVHIGNNDLAVSNILGSNVFNIFTLAAFNIFLFKRMIFKNVRKETIDIIRFSVLMYLIFILTYIGVHIFELWSTRIAFTTILMIAVYVYSLKSTNDATYEDDEEVSTLPRHPGILERALLRFLLAVVVIVFTSVILAHVADIIVIKSGLSSGIVGAVFVGIATSIPEVVTCYSLLKSKQEDMAVASIIGSNTFNFLSFSLLDFISANNIYSTLAKINLVLACIGLIFSALIFISNRLANKHKILYFMPSILIVVGYVSFVMFG